MDERLKIVYREICAHYARSTERRPRVHVDVGSDHALLLKSLLQNGIVDRGIAIEKTTPPLENSRRALLELPADVFLADGLAPIRPNQSTSMSISGMGGQSIVRILSLQMDRVAPVLIVQPNNAQEHVRKWARESGWNLQNEWITKRLFVVMSFQAAVAENSVATQDHQAATCDEDTPTHTYETSDSSNHTCDVAYQGLDLETAELFGPLLIRRRDPILFARLREEEVYLSGLPSLCEKTDHRLQMIRKALQSSDPTSCTASTQC